MHHVYQDHVDHEHDKNFHGTHQITKHYDRHNHREHNHPSNHRNDHERQHSHDNHDDKHRELYHNGTHPHKKSEHSHNHVSNPNVTHHNAVHENQPQHHTYIHDQHAKKNTAHKQNPNNLPKSPVKQKPATVSTKPVNSPKPANPVAPKKQPIVKSTATNITPNNPASQSAIQKQIDDGQNAAANYKKQTQNNSGGSVTTPQVYDYSKNWTARNGGSYNQPYPGDNGSFVSNVNKWFSDTVQNVRNWIFPGNPYY